ncbi:MAG: hypothetical protein L0241_26445 [Planctomycetia bacterium]|nr:hypothetical protein [Planctomycetia bacterium]
MNAILLSSLLLACSADEPPAPKLPLGKDTTFVLGPLDKHGYIDYEIALNAELSKGITPEKNANALLVQVFGPTPEGGVGLPPEYYKWLDIAAPPQRGDYFIGVYAHVHDTLGLSGERLEAFYEFQSKATQRAWVAKDCAPLAEWLKVNEKPLAVVIEATKRPAYFNPLVSRRKPGDPSNLIGTVLPTVQRCRELTSALTCRAMLRLQEGKFDDAWRDILACHRLGRLISRGATLIESLVGIAICQIASNSTLAYLEHPALRSKQALSCLKDLQGLPPVAPMADKIGISERMMGLDALQNIRRAGKPGALAGLVGRDDLPVIPDEMKLLEVLDWVEVMRTMNKWYDRIAEAMRMKDRIAREKEFAKIDEELVAIKKELADAEKFKKLLKEKDAGKLVGKALGDILMSLLAPAVQKVQHAHDRIEQTERNLHLACAMAAYHKDTGRYPAKLADLAPKYIPKVPNDLFNGKELIYKPTEKGYLFYSVGPNGKDEGGQWYTDDPPGDDPRVKMPLPELKKN